jgi:hypothetical protein
MTAARWPLPTHVDGKPYPPPKPPKPFSRREIELVEEIARMVDQLVRTFAARTKPRASA